MSVIVPMSDAGLRPGDDVRVAALDGERLGVWNSEYANIMATRFSGSDQKRLSMARYENPSMNSAECVLARQ
jgi:hypothetical protein